MSGLLDVVVGVGFVGVALTLRSAPLAMRVWWAMVGVAWWLGAVAPFRVLHQGVLIGALASFPAGRPRAVGQSVALGFGLMVAAGLLGQAGAAVGFLTTAWIAARRAAFVLLAAGSVGLFLAGAFIWSRARAASFQPSLALAGYELVLLLVALALPWGLAAERRRRAALTDRVLQDGPAGLSGLEVALREALRERRLRVTRKGDEVVVDGMGWADGDTVAAVDRAVSLTVAHERGLAEAAHQLAQLEAARVRLQTAADLERERAARRLRDQLAALRSCQAALCEAPDVARELGAAAADIERILAGLPPEGLGGGGIGPALAGLCGRQPGTVVLELDERASGDLAAETALFYACSEALANVAKHAHAHTVVVKLHAGDPLVLTVADDGVGGADPRGAGLLSLRDRLATVGGDLEVDSRPGSGTRVVTRVPSRR